MSTHEKGTEEVIIGAGHPTAARPSPPQAATSRDTDVTPADTPRAHEHPQPDRRSTSTATDRERVLAALHKRGPRGVSAVEFMAPAVCDHGDPITKFAARILELRDGGHRITDTGRRVGGYRVYELTGYQAPAEAVPAGLHCLAGHDWDGTITHDRHGYPAGASAAPDCPACGRRPHIIEATKADGGRVMVVVAELEVDVEEQQARDAA